MLSCESQSLIVVPFFGWHRVGWWCHHVWVAEDLALVGGPRQWLHIVCELTCGSEGLTIVNAGYRDGDCKLLFLLFCHVACQNVAYKWGLSTDAPHSWHSEGFNKYTLLGLVAQTSLSEPPWDCLSVHFNIQGQGGSCNLDYNRVFLDFVESCTALQEVNKELH